MSFEQFSSHEPISSEEEAPISRVESRRERLESETVDVMDAQGVLRFRAEKRYETIEGENGSEHVLRALILTSPDGKQSVDVLKTIGCAEDRILIDATEFAYDPNTRDIHVPEQRTIIDLYVLLHECGHAIQDRDPGFEEMTDSTRPHLVQEFYALERAEQGRLPVEQLAELRMMATEYEQSERDQEQRLKALDQSGRAYADAVQAYVRAQIPEVYDRVQSLALQDTRATSSYEVGTAWFEALQAVLDEIRNQDLMSGSDGDERYYVDEVAQFALFEKDYQDRIRAVQAHASDQSRFQKQFSEKIGPLLAPYLRGPGLDASECRKFVLERDATRRAFEWIRLLEKKLETTLRFSMATTKDALEQRLLDRCGEQIDQLDPAWLERQRRLTRDAVVDDQIDPVSFLNLQLESYGARHQKKRTKDE